MMLFSERNCSQIMAVGHVCVFTKVEEIFIGTDLHFGSIFEVPLEKTWQNNPVAYTKYAGWANCASEEIWSVYRAVLRQYIRFCNCLTNVGQKGTDQIASSKPTLVCT